MRTAPLAAAIAALLLVAAPQGAAAYIGPGAGLSAIGTLVALVGAVLLALVGFVWYPMKRLRARLRKPPPRAAGEEPDAD